MTFADFSAAGFLFLSSRRARRGTTTRARGGARARIDASSRGRGVAKRAGDVREGRGGRDPRRAAEEAAATPASVPNLSDGPRSFACFWWDSRWRPSPRRTGARTARRCLGGGARHPLRRPTDARIGGERGGFRQVFDARPGGARGGARRARRALERQRHVRPPPAPRRGRGRRRGRFDRVERRRESRREHAPGHVIVGAGVLWTCARRTSSSPRSVGSSRDVTRTTSARDSSPRVRTRPRRRYSTSRTLTCDTRRFRGFERGRTSPDTGTSSAGGRKSPPRISRSQSRV